MTSPDWKSWIRSGAAIFESEMDENTKRSSPAPPDRVSRPVPPMMTSAPSFPESLSLPRRPEMESSPLVPVITSERFVPVISLSVGVGGGVGVGVVEPGTAVVSVTVKLFGVPSYNGKIAAGDRSAIKSGAFNIEIAVRAGRTAPEIIEKRHRNGVAACGPIALDLQRVGHAAAMQGLRGQSSADLLAIDIDGVLGIALVSVLRYFQHEQIGATTDCGVHARGRWWAWSGGWWGRVAGGDGVGSAGVAVSQSLVSG